MGDRRRPLKAPRAAVTPTPGKYPRAEVTPTPSKRPAVAPRDRDERVSWRFGAADPDGPWGWHVNERLHIELHDFFSAMEQQTWPLDRSKQIPVEHLRNDAQRRLEERGLDDTEDLIELRVDGPGRVWGIRYGSVLAFLWWDPNHEVCPSPKKHT